MPLIDGVTVALMFTACYQICWLRVLSPDQLYGGSYIRHLLLALAVYALSMLLFRVWRSPWLTGQAQEYFLCCISSFLAGFVYFIISRPLLREDNRIIPFYFYFLVMCSVSLALVTVRLFLRVIRSTAQMNMRSSFVRHRTIIVGDTASALGLLREIGSTQYCNIQPLAIIPTDENAAGGKLPKRLIGIPLRPLGNGTSRIAAEIAADLIIATSPAVAAQQIDQLLASGCHVAVLDGQHLSDLRDIRPAEILGGCRVPLPSPEANGSRILVCGAPDGITRALGELLTSPDCAAAGVCARICGSDLSSLTLYGEEDLDELLASFCPDTLICTLSLSPETMRLAARVAECAERAQARPRRVIFALAEEGCAPTALYPFFTTDRTEGQEIAFLTIPQTVDGFAPDRTGISALMTDKEAAALLLSLPHGAASGVITEYSLNADYADCSLLCRAMAHASGDKKYAAEVGIIGMFRPYDSLAKRRAPSLGSSGNDGQ